VGDLFYRAAVLHVCGVAAGAQDAADSHCGIGVRGGDEGADCVADEGGEGDGEVLGERSVRQWMSGLEGTYSSLEGGFELRDNVFAFNSSNVETFRPSLQDAIVDVLLGGRVGEREAEGNLAYILEGLRLHGGTR
jgi:hypothetical protein